ncbi:MAG TPA: T9SS type A sorting domain-containing protein [Bacteroidales bacterium]|nr:T9SS type A sorting domain-containing protein [Bacteroidales bacterium]
MKTRITFLPAAMLALFFISLAGPASGSNPNFRSIDNFETGVTLWWLPQGSGSTVGIILEHEGAPATVMARDTIVVNPATRSTGSMRLTYRWDPARPVAPGSHLIRQHIPASNANVVERTFLRHQAIEVFVYGDGSGNKFRFMTREAGNNHLEGSQWFTIDWTGWRRITWRLPEDQVIGWVNGNGIWDGTHIFFDSFQLAWSGQAAGVTGTVYFDDLRIVDRFDVNFTVADAAGAIADAVIALNGKEYPAGTYNFKLFPGEFRYFVQKTGYVSGTGTFLVDTANFTIPVTLTAGTDPQFLVTFTVADAGGELITDAVLTIDGVARPAGQYTFNAAPGFYPFTVSRSGFYPTQGIVTVVDRNVFVNVEMIRDPGLFNNINLSWDVASTATDPLLRREHYSVWVARVPAGAYTFNEADFVKVFEETLGTTVEPFIYQRRSVDISGFHSSDVRVAFRHHNVTGMERLVIDNVGVIATRTGDTPAQILSEDFSAGNVSPINPDWLPQGWMAVDADSDGRTWFYGVTNNQPHMISRSRLANNNPVSPNNWLITQGLSLPVVVFYNVTFVVRDQDNANVAGATVSINGVAQQPGVYVVALPNGTHQFTISRDGYQSASGQVVVSGADRTVNVTLTQIRHEVTFRVDIRHMPGFIPGGNTIFITGNFPGINWARPGEIPALQSMDADPENVFFFSKRLNLPAGTYQYKYFNAANWNAGEWPGEPNRQVIVTGPMTVNDVFGSQPGATAVPVITETATAINLFPNPARTVLNIAANEMISEVRIIDMLGQVVYSATASGNNHLVNVGDLKYGIYFVQIKTQTGLHTKRLQVVK